jgi:hypothetical protein
MPKTKFWIVDWVGNNVYPGKDFNSEQDAFAFLAEDQHKRHPNVTEDEFNAIMSEFHVEFTLCLRTSN